MIRFQRLIILVSVLLFGAKLTAWYLTRSVAILTDALESTVNVVTAIIGLYTLRFAARPRDANHPYGHGKAEYISAAIEGALITAAGLFIIAEAVRHLLHATPVFALDTGLIIIASTGVVNFFLGRRALHIARMHRSPTLEAAGKHLLSDALSTGGIVAGLIAVYFTKWQPLDAIIALVFAVMILYQGYTVLRRAVSGIMDEADVKLLGEVVSFLQKIRRPQWIDLHNLRALQYGQMLHLDAHMTLPWYFTVTEAERELHALEDETLAHFGGKVEVFVHIDACAPYSCKLCTMPECAVRQESFKARVAWTVENAMIDSKHGKDTITISQPTNP